MQPDRGAVKVLLVEDNPADAALTGRMLGDAFEVTHVETLAAAIDAVVARCFDAALLDMTLPDAASLDALARLREAAPLLPIVILSGSEDERAMAGAVRAGAQEYLRKGEVTEANLRRSLRYAIEREELRERLAASIDELERQRAAVVHLHQLKNDLIAVLAHDIKGPLTSIVGFSELLEEGLLDGDAAIDAARTIRTNAQRLATLANDVLALSRVEHGDLEIADDRVDLVDVVRKVVDLHGTEREIRVDAPAAGAAVRGDRERLVQVLDNLLRNAIKYSPGGEPIEIAFAEGDGTIRLTVRDRGIGIPPEETERLFERFARGSNARKAKIAGTGIGLFIVKMIVERHGGRIEVESALGAGSAFTVVLPSYDALGAVRQGRILLLMADQALSRFAAFELRARGLRVREVAALDEAAATARDGDALVVDAALAGCDEVRAALKGVRHVRFVGLTAEPVPGWDATLRQPFLVSELLDALGPSSSLFALQ